MHVLVLFVTLGITTSTIKYNMGRRRTHRLLRASTACRAGSMVAPDCKESYSFYRQAYNLRAKSTHFYRCFIALFGYLSIPNWAHRN